MIPSSSIVSLRYLIVTKRDEIPSEGECILVDNDLTISYWLNGKHHRDDGPAVEYPDGSKYWFRDGKRVHSKRGKSK